MPRLLAMLCNYHANETAWIFGKGPGLDFFDPNKAGKLRICINESTLLVPEVTYFFAHDEIPIKNVSKAWPPNCTAILQPDRARYAINCGIPETSIVTYEKKQADMSVLELLPYQLSSQGILFGLSGTVHSAIHFCHMTGVRKIVFVGFEGKGNYAKCLGLKNNGRNFSIIRKQSIDILKKLNIEYEFFLP